VGIILACGLIIYDAKARLRRKIGAGTLAPEDRLHKFMLDRVLLPLGLFWIAWTSNPGVSWVAQVFAELPIGVGIFLVFIQTMAYIIDVYHSNSASAFAAVIYLRNVFGGVFPLFAQAMVYDLIFVSRVLLTLS
jgi:DHA1 family multidrug resistance protein-like MFS transporter